MRMLRSMVGVLAVVSTPTMAADWITTITAADNYGGSYGTIRFNDWGYTGPAGVGANDYQVGTGFDAGNLGQIQRVVTVAADWQTSDPTRTIYTDPLARDPSGVVYSPQEQALPNANMDGNVNFYKWAYTTPTSTFSNMQIDRAGNYYIAKNDMSFGYYDETHYNNGVDPIANIDSGINFQPYAISDARGWCGSVLTEDPNGLAEMAGQVTFDFAFDVNFSGFVSTQVVPDFVMRSYGDYEVDIYRGNVRQHYIGSAVANNTNPLTGELDPDYQNRVSFLGAGVIPTSAWVINAGTPDVQIVEEGTPGATLHTNVYGGYAFLLRADAQRTLEFISPDGHSIYIPTAVVPVPAAVWLFVSGLLGLFATGRRCRMGG